MKKAIVIMLTGAMMLAAVACGGGSTTTTTPAADTQTEETEAEATEETEEAETTVEETTDAETTITEEAMSYADYAAAEVDSEVVIDGAVQGKQSYYAEQGTASIYLQDEDGAYFLYNLPCTEKEYELMEVGTMIKVKGYKAEWSGEVEVIDAVWTFVDGEYVAEAEDVTELLGTDELINKQNMKVMFKGMTVEAAGQNDAGEDVAYLYNWDGSGSEGDDLYFNVSYNGQTYSFTVESYLCGPDTDVYKAVKDLHIGDVIDMEGFLYWYEGPNPHITAILAQ